MRTVTKTEPAFWDASAIVPLCTWQPPSSRIRRIASAYGNIVVWWGTIVEVRSAFARLGRTGEIDPAAIGAVLGRLERLPRVWKEILPTERVRDIAEGIPEAYGLTAADSFQLAAALVWSNGRPRGRPFVVLDDRLAAAAAKAGFTVLDPLVD